MPRTCTLCCHSDRSAIDRELLAGTPYRNISERFGLSVAAITRHRPHIAAKIAVAERDAGIATIADVQRRMVSLQARVETLVGKLESGRRSPNHACRIARVPRRATRHQRGNRRKRPGPALAGARRNGGPQMNLQNRQNRLAKIEARTTVHEMHPFIICGADKNGNQGCIWVGYLPGGAALKGEEAQQWWLQNGGSQQVKPSG